MHAIYNYADKSIPAYIQNQLNEPPPLSGGRHAAWMRLSYQMVGENLSDGVIFPALRQWIPDDDKSDKELRELIAGARQRSPLPAHRRSEEQPQDKQPALPSDLENTGPMEFMNRLFYPGECICITLPDS